MFAFPPIWAFPCPTCDHSLDTVDWQPGQQCTNCAAVVLEHANAERVKPSGVLPLGLGPFSSFQDQSNWYLGRCPHCSDAQLDTEIYGGPIRKAESRVAVCPAEVI